MLGYKEVGEILNLIDSSSCEEVVLETQEVKLVVRRQGSGGTSAAPQEAGAAPPAPSPARASPAPQAAAPAPEEPAAGAGMVRAPMVGTFYRAPSPDEPPFVELGSPVAKGDPLCMIEVMKLFTTVHAESDGVIASIGAENGQLVEFGQILFSIEPG